MLKGPSIDKQCIFRCGFSSEEEVRREGGVPINVTFLNGVASFNGSSSYIQFKFNTRATYSVRIKFKSITSIVSTKLILDFRASGTDNGGIAVTDGTITGGTSYIDGSASSAITLSSKELICSGIAVSSVSGYFRLCTSFVHSAYFGVDIELLEIYKGTLTAQQVKALYNNSAYTQLQKPNLLLYLNAFDGVISDKSGLRTITNTGVTVVKDGGKNVMSFDGVANKLDLGSDFLGTSNLMLSCWVKSRTYGTSTQGYIITNTKFIFLLTSTNSTFLLTRNGATTAPASNGSAGLSKWTNVIMTSTSSGVTNIYINGVASGTVNLNAGTPADGTNVIIGLGTSKVFNGLISNIKIWSGTPTDPAQEAMQIYMSEKGRYGL